MFILLALLCFHFVSPQKCFQELRDISITPENTTLWTNASRTYNPDWNGDVHVEPSFVAIPRNENDIQRALQCAKREGIRVSVKSGGHSFGQEIPNIC